MRNLIFILLLFPMMGWTQKTSTLEFYSEESINFKVLLNGITQNEESAHRIIITNVTRDAFSLRTKFIFDDENVGEVKAMLVFHEGSKVTYKLSRSAQVMRVTEESIVPNTTDIVPGNAIIVEYRGEVEAEAPVDNIPIETEVVFKVSGTGEISKVSGGNEHGDVVVEDNPVEAAAKVYEGPTGCDNPTPNEMAGQIAEDLGKADSDEARQKMLPGLISGKCLTVPQIERILLTFESEKGRLTAAKKLYKVLWDQANVGQLKSLFESPANWNSFIEFINNYGG